MVAYNSEGKFLFKLYNADGTEVETGFDDSGNEITNQTYSLKVMTYNVGQWYLGNHDNVPEELDQTYYFMQNSIIKAENPDILFLNEYATEFSKTGRSAKTMLEQYFPYIENASNSSTTGDNTSGFNRAICSKYPIIDYKRHYYHQDSYLDWYYDSCTVIIHSIPIVCIITHLHYNNPPLRAEEAATLLSFVSNFPNFILAGDFNVNKNDYATIIKSFADAGYHIVNLEGNYARFLTYSGNTVNLTSGLDHIITSNNFTEIEAHTNETKVNDYVTEKIDHIPLIATFTF